MVIVLLPAPYKLNLTSPSSPSSSPPPPSRYPKKTETGRLFSRHDENSQKREALIVYLKCEVKNKIE
jgi:hypothetical protein